MNPIAEEILMHYGMPKRSGRYPWGSGGNPYQHSGDFMSRVNELKKSGMSEKEVASALGLTTTQLRTQVGLAKDERRSIEVATARGLREKGYSLNEIADKMGYNNDSSVSSLLNEGSEARMNQAKLTADFLKKQVDEKGMIDVGVGVERELGVSIEKMKQALYILEMDGYEIYGGGVPQVTNPGKQTNIQVLCPPGTEHKDIYNFGEVHSVRDYVTYNDATAAEAEVLLGKTAFARGAKLTGTMPNNGAVSKKITAKAQEVTIPQGYHDGSGKVAIDVIEQNKLIANNVRQGVTVLGVLGTLEPSSAVTAQAKTVTPTKAQQIVLPDANTDYLSQVTISAIPYVESDNPAGGITVTIAG